MVVLLNINHLLNICIDALDLIFFLSNLGVFTLGIQNSFWKLLAGYLQYFDCDLVLSAYFWHFVKPGSFGDKIRAKQPLQAFVLSLLNKALGEGIIIILDELEGRFFFFFFMNPRLHKQQVYSLVFHPLL